GQGGSLISDQAGSADCRGTVPDQAAASVLVLSRRLVTTTATNTPARPIRVRIFPPVSTPVPANSMTTSHSVGTTTISEGDERHGPSAPVAFQLGKYETLTMWGTPIAVVVNEMRWSSTTMLETVPELVSSVSGRSEMSVMRGQ